MASYAEMYREGPQDFQPYHSAQMYRRNPTNGSISLHRPRIHRKSDEKLSSSLTTKFDPMKDRHMWAMWRTAVNGRLIDQLLHDKPRRDISGVEDSNTPLATNAPPLSRFIRLNQSSQDIARELMNEGHGELQTSQFIFYGLPRVSVSGAGDFSHVLAIHAAQTALNDLDLDQRRDGVNKPSPEFNPYS